MPKYFVMIYAAMNLFSGLTASSSSNVAYFAHIGGAIFGFILVKFGDKLRIFEFTNKIFNIFSPSGEHSSPPRPASPLRRVDVHQPASQPQVIIRKTGRGSGFYYEGQEIPQGQIDLILDKISSK